jgi:hypothetical protein
MIIMNGGKPDKHEPGLRPAGQALHGRALELYTQYAKAYAKPDWMLATLCNMQAAIEDNNREMLHLRELIGVNEERIRELEAMVIP